MLVKYNSSDPFGGSPPNTVLRLVPPSNDVIHGSSLGKYFKILPQIRTIHQIIQSVEATGGVYKGQGRN